MTVNTPCIGRCSTVYGDKICRGCRRYAQEIIAWNHYSDPEKRSILLRLSQQVEQLLSGIFIVQDGYVLHSALTELGVRFEAEQPVLTWVMSWLNSGYADMSALSSLGISLRSEYQGYAIKELKALIEQQLYDLACGHYERYHAFSWSE